MSPNTVEVVNNEPLSSVNSTKVGEPDDHQIKSGSLQKRLIQKVKNQKSKRDALVLRDLTNNVGDVQPVNTSIQSSDILQGQLVPSMNDRFKALIEQEGYGKIFEIGEKMNEEEFLKQLCPVVKTFDQYKDVAKYLERHKMVAPFYVHGDIEVVKKVIVESRVYDGETYLDGGYLETALFLALKEDSHVRFVELLDVRKGITAQKDERPKLEGGMTNFGYFVHALLDNLAPCGKNGTALRRFLVLSGEELSIKYPDILDTLCQEFMIRLSAWLPLPKVESLLLDLIGQPSLLTPEVSARGFLHFGNDWYRSVFVKYGWRETIQEGLKTRYWNGGKELWRVMQKEKPNEFHGEFPDTEEARAVVCMHIPTKQQKEEEWTRKNAAILYAKLNSESISHIFPDVLWSIIFGYAVSLTFTEDSTVSAK